MSYRNHVLHAHKKCKAPCLWVAEGLTKGTSAGNQLGFLSGFPQVDLLLPPTTLINLHSAEWRCHAAFTTLHTSNRLVRQTAMQPAYSS